MLRLDDLLLDPMVAQSWALPLVQDVKLIKSLGMQSASIKSWNGAMQISVFFFFKLCTLMVQGLMWKGWKWQ